MVEAILTVEATPTVEATLTEEATITAEATAEATTTAEGLLTAQALPAAAAIPTGEATITVEATTAEHITAEATSTEAISAAIPEETTLDGTHSAATTEATLAIPAGPLATAIRPALAGSSYEAETLNSEEEDHGNIDRGSLGGKKVAGTCSNTLEPRHLCQVRRTFFLLEASHGRFSFFCLVNSLVGRVNSPLYISKWAQSLRSGRRSAVPQSFKLPHGRIH